MSLGVKDGAGTAAAQGKSTPIVPDLGLSEVVQRLRAATPVWAALGTMFHRGLGTRQAGYPWNHPAALSIAHLLLTDTQGGTLPLDLAEATNRRDFRLNPLGKALVYALLEEDYAAREGAATFFGSENLADEDVLDFGCGGGAYTRAALARGARRVIACDANPQAVAVMVALMESAAVSKVGTNESQTPTTDPQGESDTRPEGASLRNRWLALTIPRGPPIPLPSASVDMVLARLVLPYVDPEATLAEFARMLRPGGRLLLLTHRFRYYVEGLGAALRDRQARRVAHMVFSLASGAALRWGGRPWALPDETDGLRRDHPLEADTLLRLLDKSGFDGVPAATAADAGSARLLRMVAQRRKR